METLSIKANCYVLSARIYPEEVYYMHGNIHSLTRKYTKELLPLLLNFISFHTTMNGACAYFHLIVYTKYLTSTFKSTHLQPSAFLHVEMFLQGRVYYFKT